MAEVTAGPEGLTIAPGRFMLATTLEWIRLSTELVAHLDGKSSLGRLGLLIHSTSGLIVMRLDAPAQFAYGASKLGSKYQGRSGPGESRFFEDADGGLRG